MIFQTPQLRKINGDKMYKAMPQSPKFRAEKKAMGFNLSKLQAVACVALSVLASISLIYFGVTALI